MLFLFVARGTKSCLKHKAAHCTSFNYTLGPPCSAEAVVGCLPKLTSLLQWILPLVKARHPLLSAMSMVQVGWRVVGVLLELIWHIRIKNAEQV